MPKPNTIKIDTDTLMSWAREYSSMFDWKIGKFPLHISRPTIVDRKKSRWLGGTSIKLREDGLLSVNILIQKSCLYNERTARRVLLHEMIHYYIFFNHPSYEKWAKTRQIHYITEMSSDMTGHDHESFQRIMKIVNRRLGKDFVTTHLDDSYVGHL